MQVYYKIVRHLCASIFDFVDVKFGTYYMFYVRVFPSRFQSY